MLIQTPDINHRYYGWRESAKLIVQSSGSIADVSNLMTAILKAQYKYDTYYALEAHITTMDNTISAIQSARVTLEFIRENYGG